jgi:hypothetical protein
MNMESATDPILQRFAGPQYYDNFPDEPPNALVEKRD